MYSIKNNIYEKKNVATNVTFVYCIRGKRKRLLNISLIYVFGIELEIVFDFFTLLI